MKPTQEQVIAWARKYGDWNGQTVEMNDVGLEAAYAAAYEAGRTAEREKVAAWMIQRSYATGHGDTIEGLLTELEWQIREAEREACAVVCDKLGDEYADTNAADCAFAIRERGAP